MSSLVTNGLAARLTSRTCRQTQRQLTSPWHTCSTTELLSRRRYASKVIKPIARPPGKRSPSASSPPPPSRGPRLLAREGLETAKDPNRLIFSARDVPTLPEWKISLESLGNPNLKPMQCMEGALRYVSVATQEESKWRGKLEKDHNLPPWLLHWIGVLLLSSNNAIRWRLGTHVLRSASELGYSPSTLTLVRIFRSMPTATFKQRAAHTKLFLSADARFKEILQRGTDPDALTLQGIIDAKHGGTEKALAMFRRATRAWEKANPGSHGMDGQTESKSPAPERRASTAGRPGVTDESNDHHGLGEATPDEEFTLPPPREPRWEWEVSCVLGQANALRDLGKRREAEELYRVAALELDNPRAFLELSKIMDGPRDSPRRRTYLLKAAISGEVEACREMAKLENLAATKKGLSEKERAEHKLMSMEWMRLADGEEMATVKAVDGESDPE